MSPHDRKNVGLIISGHGSWFGAKLIRLILNADSNDRDRLRAGFADEVAAVEHWIQHGDAPATADFPEQATTN